MPQCKICDSDFKRRIKIDNHPVLLSASRKTCLECNPIRAIGGAPTRRRKKINGVVKRQCSKCNEYLDDSHFPKKTGLICKSCRPNNNLYIRLRKIELKLLAVQYLGSKCKSCKNIFPICAYGFHHRDPSEKDFEIAKAGYIWTDKMQRELDKCDLLCHNCHSIEHSKHPGSLQLP